MNRPTAPYAVVMQIIHVIRVEGDGTAGDPKRTVDYYITLDGKFRARHDAWEEEQRSKEVAA